MQKQRPLFRAHVHTVSYFHFTYVANAHLNKITRYRSNLKSGWYFFGWLQKIDKVDLIFSRTSKINLICEPEATDHKLEFIGELISTEYVSSKKCQSWNFGVGSLGCLAYSRDAWILVWSAFTQN